MREPTAARAHLTPISNNHKVGPIAVSTTSRDTCPARCPLRATKAGLRGCYADGQPLRGHWDLVDSGERGVIWSQFCREVANLPAGRMLRLSQAGDQPTGATPDRISRRAMIWLAQARQVSGNGPERGGVTFGYTHHRLSRANLTTLALLRQQGIVINASADSLDEARRIRQRHPDLPLTVLVPSDFATPLRDPDLGRVVVCPAQTGSLSCATCGAGSPLCARPVRDYVIAFRAHGIAHQLAGRVALREAA